MRLEHSGHLAFTPDTSKMLHRNEPTFSTVILKAPIFSIPSLPLPFPLPFAKLYDTVSQVSSQSFQVSPKCLLNLSKVTVSLY